MDSEKITLYKASDDKTRLIEQYPKTVSSNVYDFKNNKFMSEVLNDVSTQLAQNVKVVARPKSLLQKSAKSTDACFIFIADDAPKNDLTRLMPIFIGKNAPVGIGVITNAVGKTVSGMGEMMTWSDIAWCVQNGAEVLAHTHLHRDSTTITEEELDEDLRTCKQILNDHGYTAESLIFPYNGTSYATERIARKYFDYAFSKKGALTQSYGQNFPLIDNMRIGRIALGSFYDVPSSEYVNQDTTSLAYYKERVDEVIANNALGVFVLHTHTNNFSEVAQQQHLRDVIDYIRAQGAEVVSPSEGVARHSNIIQVGSYVEANRFIMDKTGKVTANDSELYEYVELNSVNGNTPTANFTRNKITVCRITGAYATTANGFPIAADGSLITYYLDTWYGNVYQEFIPFDNKKQAYRRNLQSGSVWGTWSPKNLQVNFDVLNGRNGADLATTYPVGITKTLFNSTGASNNNMPYARGGTLTTTKLSSDYWSIKQEYVVSAILDTTNNREVKYVRYVNSDGSWTAWRRVGTFLAATPNITVTTITANSTRDLTVNAAGVLTGDDVNVVFTTALPSGLIWSLVAIADGNVTIRLANITATTITTDTLSCNIFATRIE